MNEQTRVGARNQGIVDDNLAAGAPANDGLALAEFDVVLAEPKPSAEAGSWHLNSAHHLGTSLLVDRRE
jgi:hypothetical protein